MEPKRPRAFFGTEDPWTQHFLIRVLVVMVVHPFGEWPRYWNDSHKEHS